MLRNSDCRPCYPCYESIQSFLSYFQTNNLSLSSTFSPSDTPDLLNAFLMKHSNPNDPDTLPYQQSALILLLLHPLIRLNSSSNGSKIKSSNRNRTLTLQLIGRCVRRCTRLKLKSLPIIIPLMIPHLSTKDILETIVRELHVDLSSRINKNNKSNELSDVMYSDPLLHNLLIVFDFFYLMNESFDVISYSGRLPFSSFYHLFPEEFIREDYARWLTNQNQSHNQSQVDSNAFTFCDFPWIFDLSCKRILLIISNELKQRHQLQDSFFRAIFDGVQLPYLSISIRRSHLLLDAFEQIDHLPLHQVTRQLRVTFIGEEGVDEGGLRKEFFQLCFNEIFHFKKSSNNNNSQNYLFTQLESSNLFWFSPPAHSYRTPSLEYCKLVGILVGLAIYNNVLIEPLFPMFLYKKLLNWPVTLDDFSEIDPQIVRSINQLHTMQTAEEVESLHLYHVVSVGLSDSDIDTAEMIPLIPNGHEIPVTIQNFQNYLRLLTNFYLSDSEAFRSFRSGFELISIGSVIYGYRPDEVYSLIHGTSTFNLSAMRSITNYEGGFTDDNPTIQWLWSIISESFTHSQQEDFLFFVTGSKRLPIDGITSFTIVRVGGSGSYSINTSNPGSRTGTRTTRITTSESQSKLLSLPLPLPTAHTCFNTLLLCEYPSKQELHEKLLISLANNHGFGLI